MQTVKASRAVLIAFSTDQHVERPKVIHPDLREELELTRAGSGRSERKRRRE